MHWLGWLQDLISIITQELSAVLDIAVSNNPIINCLGDMNCDLLHPCDDARDDAKQGRRALLNICDFYADLHILINELKGFSLTKESCIDVILTNTPAFVPKSGTLESGDFKWSFVDIYCPKHNVNETKNHI